MANKKAYYAYKIDNSLSGGSYLWIEDERKIIGKGFSFDIWFYPEENNLSYSLVDKPETFDLHVSNRELFFLDRATKMEIKIYGVRCEPNKWNHIFLTYDGTKLCCYFFGYQVCSRNVNLDITPFRTYEVGRGLTGFIRTLRFYDTAISAMDLRKYIYKAAYNEEEMPNILAFFQCQLSPEKKPELKNLKKNSIFKATPEGGCDPLAVTHAYIVNDRLIERSGSINPGGFKNREFSIYIKFLITSCLNESKEVLLVSNANCPEYQKAAVKLVPKEGKSNEYYVNVSLGEKTYAVEKKIICSNRWTDILVTFHIPQENQGELSVFIDGKEGLIRQKVISFIRKVPGEFSIGEKTGSGFKEYIASVAVFDKVLKKEDAEYFHENEPFLYEDGLRALYDFQDGLGCRELLSGKALKCDDPGAKTITKLVPLEPGSMESILTDDLYQYRKTRMPQPSIGLDYIKASTLLKIITGYYSAMYDFEVNDKIVEDLLNYFWKELADDSEMSKLYDSYVMFGFIKEYEKCRVELCKILERFHEFPESLANPAIKVVTALYFEMDKYKNWGYPSFIASAGMAGAEEKVKMLDLYKGLQPVSQALRSAMLPWADKVNNNRAKKAYYACKIDNLIEKNNSEESYLELALGHKRFPAEEMSFDIWFYPEKDTNTYELITNPNGVFTLGVKGNVAYCKFMTNAADKKEDTITCDSILNAQVRDNVWSHLFVTLTTSKICVYLGGLLIGSKETNIDIFHSPWLACFLGKGFTGFIRTVRVYDKSIPDMEFYKYIYQTTYDEEKMPNILSFLQCQSNEEKTEVEVRDIGKYAFPVFLVKNCFPSSVMHACVFPGKAGTGLIDEEFSLNKLRNFSIYAKICLQKQDISPEMPDFILGINVVLDTVYSYNDKDLITGPNHPFRIQLSQSEKDAFHVVVSTNNWTEIRSVGGDCIIKPGEWVDLLVTREVLETDPTFMNTVTKERFSIFVNGKLDSTFELPGFELKVKENNAVGGSQNKSVMKIGAAKVEITDEKTGDISTYNIGFSGSIASIAIFDKLLNEKDAQAFFENEPFIYEDGLKALYNFDDGIGKMELLSGRTLKNIQGEEVSIQLRKIPDTFLNSSYQYRVTKEEPDYPSRIYGRALAFLAPLIEYYHTLYGLEVNSYDAQVCEDFITYFGKQLTDDLYLTSCLSPYLTHNPSTRNIENDVLQAINLFHTVSHPTIKALVAALHETEINQDGSSVFPAFITGTAARVSQLIPSISNFREQPIIRKMISNAIERFKLPNIGNNNRSYPACRLLGDENSRIKISGIGKYLKENKFSFSIWVNPAKDNMNYCIFETMSETETSPDGLVRLKIVYHRPKNYFIVYFTCSDGKKYVENVKVDESAPKIESNKRNNVIITWDGTNLYFYIQGEAAANLQSLPALDSSCNSMVIGEQMRGFILSMQFYAGVIPVDDVKRYMFLDFIRYSKLVEEDKKYTMCRAFVWSVFDKAAASSRNEVLNCIQNGVSVTLEGQTELARTLSVYSPDKQRPAIATINNSESSAGGDFSIYAKFYLKDYTDVRKQVIFYEVTKDNKEVSIALEAGEDGDYIQVVVDKLVLNYKDEENFLTFNDWNDILVVYGLEKENDEKYEKLLWIFVNGKWHPKGTIGVVSALPVIDGEVALGCEKAANSPFGGFLTTVAVFNKALTEEDAYDFHENEPFLYEDGLCALFTVTEQGFVDLVSCKKIEGVDQDIKLIFGTNTGNVPPYQYRMNKKNLPDLSQDPFYADDTEFVLIPLVDVWCSIYGLAVDPGILDSVKIFFGKEINSWFKDTLLAKEFTAENIIEAYNELNEFQKLRLSLLLNPTSFFALSSTDTVQNRMLFVGGMMMLALVGIVYSLLIAEVIAVECMGFNDIGWNGDLLNDRRKIPMIEGGDREDLSLKDAGDRNQDEKKKKETELIGGRILSLTFCVSPENPGISSVHARNYKGAITTPEWNTGDFKSKEIVYIADELQRSSSKVQVKMELEIWRIGKGERKINIQCTGKTDRDAPVNNFYGEISVVVVHGYNEVICTLEAQQKNPLAGDIYYYSRWYVWEVEIDGIRNTPAVSRLKMYTLPTTPSAPFSLKTGEERFYPMVELIDIGANKLYALSGRASERLGGEKDEARVLQQGEPDMQMLTTRLYLNQNFTYRSGEEESFPYLKPGDEITRANPELAQWINADRSYMDVGAFERQLEKIDKAQPVGMECTGYAYMLVALYLLNGGRRMPGTNTGAFYFSSPENMIKTHSVYIAGSPVGWWGWLTARIPRGREYNYHVVAEINDLFYDACCSTSCLTASEVAKSQEQYCDHIFRTENLQCGFKEMIPASPPPSYPFYIEVPSELRVVP